MKRLLPLFLLAGCVSPSVRFPVGGMRECPRPLPKAVLSGESERIRSTRFRELTKETAKETARMDAGVLLTILHYGCSETRQEFRFLLPVREAAVVDRAYWFRRAAGLFRSLAVGAPESGFDGLAAALEAKAETPPPYDEAFESGAYQTLAVWAGDAGSRRSELAVTWTFHR